MESVAPIPHRELLRVTCNGALGNAKEFRRNLDSRAAPPTPTTVGGWERARSSRGMEAKYISHGKLPGFRFTVTIGTGGR